MHSLGLYIHWPFCLSKCPYCDFNSHVREKIDQSRWRQALLTEIRTLAAMFASAEAYKLRTIFWGGGTPSLIDPETVNCLIQEAKTLWNSDPDLEITLEANPTSVEAQKFEAFRKAGVNRVSLGIQSFQDQALHFLGRQHSSQQGQEAVRLAQDIFPRFSFDLIYARPTQTLAAWQEELGEALPFAQGHLSLYQLTYEPGTPFYTRFQRGELTYPDEEAAVRFYELTGKITKDFGFSAYEVSNYAQDGHACQHNLIYWRGFSYLGVGPGAHGRMNVAGQTWAMRTHRAPEIWLARVESQGHGLTAQDPLSPRDLFIERMLMGLRLSEGVALKRLETETGRCLQEWVPPHCLEALQREGWGLLTRDALYLTDKGRLRLNQIVSYLTASA